MLRYLLELSTRNPLFAIDPDAGLKMAQVASLMLSKAIPVTGEAFGMDKIQALDYNVGTSSGGVEQVSKVRVITIHGLMTMNGGPCSHGMIDYGNMLKRAANDPSVAAIVIDGSTPGGEAVYAETFAQIVNEVNNIKPVLTWANQMIASAGYYFASASSEIMISGRAARVGSIGTLINYLDLSKKMENEGVQEVLILASKSTNKRKYNFSQPTEDDKAAIIEGIIDPFNEIFLSDVIRYRPQVKAEALTGEMFQGQAAIDMGLADSIGTIEDAITRAAELAKIKNENSQNMNTQQKENQGLLSKMQSMIQAALAGKPEVTLVSEADPEAVSNPIAETDQDKLIASLKAENEALKTQLAAQQTTIDQQNQEFKKLQSEVETLGRKVTSVAPPLPVAQDLPGNTSSEYVFEETQKAIAMFEASKK